MIRVFAINKSCFELGRAYGHGHEDVFDYSSDFRRARASHDRRDHDYVHGHARARDYARDVHARKQTYQQD